MFAEVIENAVAMMDYQLSEVRNFILEQKRDIESTCENMRIYNSLEDGDNERSVEIHKVLGTLMKEQMTLNFHGKFKRYAALINILPQTRFRSSWNFILSGKSLFSSGS
jgi:hypothetical protein